MLNRYQVKPKEKDWNDPGPDLLRTRANAIQQAESMLNVKGPWSWRKQRPDGTWFGWREVGDRQDVEKWLAEALPGLSESQVGQVGRQTATGYAIRVVVKGRAIAVPDLTNATPAAETTHALIRARFPDVKFGGCFVCKRYNGSTDPSVGWSDHAWGDAVDETEDRGAGLTNDALTDWNVRMAREGLLPVEQIIGSVKGQVYTFEAPGFAPVLGGPESHTWHNHLSCRQHTGTPPCA